MPSRFRVCVLGLAMTCSAGCASQDECALGEEPCGERAGTYYTCEYSTSGHMPDFNPSNDGNFRMEHACDGIEPVCRPKGHGHVCEDARAPEACAESRVLLDGLPYQAVSRLLVANLTPDARPDVLLACASESRAPCGLWLVAQRSDSRFERPIEIGAYRQDAYTSFDVFTGDVDGDRLSDVVVNAFASQTDASNGEQRRTLEIRLARDEYGRSATHVLDVDERFQRLADLDGDGRAELLLTDRRAILIFAVLDGQLALRERIDVETVGDESYAWDLVAPDLLGTGEPMLVLRRLNEAHAFVPRDGQYVEGLDLDAHRYGTSSLTSAYVDFDGDRASDYVSAYSSEGGGSASVAISDRAGGFGMSSAVRLPYAPLLYDALIGDVDADGALDLVPIHGMGRLTLVLGDGKGGLQAPRTFQLDQELQQPWLLDIDGDGSMDMLDATTQADGTTSLIAWSGVCL